AIAQTTFTTADNEFTREYFTSHDHNVGVIRLTAKKKASIGFALHFYRDERISDYRMQKGKISFSGTLPDGHGGLGMRFAGQVRDVPKGGTQQEPGHQLIVTNADQGWIYRALPPDS